MRIRILDRYLMREFSGPFLFCIFGFTIVLLTGLLFQLSDMIFVNDVPVLTVSKLLLYGIPEAAVSTVPVACLFATLLAVGRIVQDNEMTVLRASGVSYPRLVLPILFLGLVASVLTFLASEHIVPAANRKFENIVRQIVFSEGVPIVDEKVFFHGGEDRYFYIEEVDRKTNELKNVLVWEVDRGGFPRVISAKSGIFQERNWVLLDGVAQELDDEGFVAYESRFQRLEIVTEEPGEVYFGSQRTVSEMNRRELATYIARFQRSGLKVLSFVVDYHMKLSLPMACLVLALFGAPLALRAKGGRSFGIVVSLVVMLFYYISVAISRSLGMNEFLPPLVAAWIVNIIFALAGFVLLREADKLR